jgi:DNA binding domain, excisionase family
MMTGKTQFEYESLWRFMDAAKYLNVPESTVRYWVHIKAIKFIKLGKLVRFNPEQIRKDSLDGKIGELEQSL